MREGILRLMLVVTSLLVAAVIVEVAFRVTSRTPWYDRLEQEQNPFFVPKRRVGDRQFKLRSALEATPKPADAYRILFLGDSFTYGSGVVDASKVFASLVADELNARKSLVRRTEVFNGGIPGSLTRHWVDLFEEAVDPFEPDMVVAVFFLRDGTRGVGGSRANIQRVGRAMAKLSEESWLFRHVHTYRFFRERRAQREFSREYLTAMKLAYLGEDDETEEWQRARSNLLRIRDETERRGGRFSLVIFPVLFALGPDYPLEEVCEEIERFARESEIPTLSLLPAFRGERAPSLWVSPLDQHPNERAHGIAAKAISEFLRPWVAGS